MDLYTLDPCWRPTLQTSAVQLSRQPATALLGTLPAEVATLALGVCLCVTPCSMRNGLTLQAAHTLPELIDALHILI